MLCVTNYDRVRLSGSSLPPSSYKEMLVVISSSAVKSNFAATRMEIFSNSSLIEGQAGVASQNVIQRPFILQNQLSQYVPQAKQAHTEWIELLVRKLGVSELIYYIQIHF
jgi:hypothetical protein